APAAAGTAGRPAAVVPGRCNPPERTAGCPAPRAAVAPAAADGRRGPACATRYTGWVGLGRAWPTGRTARPAPGGSRSQDPLIRAVELLLSRYRPDCYLDIVDECSTWPGSDPASLTCHQARPAIPDRPRRPGADG